MAASESPVCVRGDRGLSLSGKHFVNSFPSGRASVGQYFSLSGRGDVRAARQGTNPSAVALLLVQAAVARRPLPWERNNKYAGESWLSSLGRGTANKPGKSWPSPLGRGWPSLRGRVRGRFPDLTEMEHAELREALQLSQEELAKKLKVTQAAIPRLERRPNVLLESLANYVQAQNEVL